MPSVLLKLTISGQQGKQRLNSLSSVETDTRGQMFCKYVNMSPKQVPTGWEMLQHRVKPAE